jgi:hypothetical protein
VRLGEFAVAGGDNTLTGDVGQQMRTFSGCNPARHYASREIDNRNFM